MKEISIIIATYNAEKYIQRCIASIKINKSDDIELIIIDGQSNDNTLQIIKDNSQDIDIWISEKDKGIYDAWNKGLMVAKGKWIMFLGSDDQLQANAIKSYLAYLKIVNTSDIDYICALNDYVDSRGAIISTIGEDCTWLKMRKYMSAAHVGSLHNRKLYEEVGYYDIHYKICADYELLLRKRNLLKSVFIPQKIATMEIGGMSFSFSAIKELYQIRKHHNTLSPFQNQLYFLRNVLTFYLLKIKLILNN